jgi:predicted methyltransferase
MALIRLLSRCALAGALAQACVWAAPVPRDLPDYIAVAVADPTRPAEDRKLDADRKPGEVLRYAGVRPGEIVAEFLPGGGYYTRLLSHIVGSGGKVYALETTTWGEENVSATRKVLGEPGHSNVVLDLAPLGSFHLPQQVDLFFTSLNYHDLHVSSYAKIDMAAFNRAVFAAIKPGGTFVIIDHAAAKGTGARDASTLHRIEESTVVQEVTAAGFRLIGRSDLLRNPQDDHTRKVFDPAIRRKTDQFILKFERP